MFSHDQIRFDKLKKYAFNYRWAEVEDGVLPMTAADSDFPVAPALKKGLLEYIDGGYYNYAPKLGYDEVRQSIAEGLNRRKAEGIDPSMVLPVDSAARGMYIIAETILQPGDEMLVFDPVDYLFAASARAAGADVRRFPCRLVENRIDLSNLESYIGEKTRMIGLCNPHNPLGTLYSEEDLALILDLAEKHDLYIMNDEIWSDIVYAPETFTSIYNVKNRSKDRVLSVYGFSKSFGVAGLRVGCVYTQNRELFDALVEHSDVLTTAGGVASISQIAAKICMDECYDYCDAYVAHLRGNRDYAIERINKMPLITCRKPEATFVLFADISATGMESAAFVDYLKEEVRLALVPGTEEFFGPGAKGHVRICLATSRELVTEGMNRLEEGLKRIQNKR